MAKLDVGERKMTKKKQAKTDDLLKKYPNMSLTAAMMSAGEDEITLDEEMTIKPVSKFGPGEDDLLLEEPGFTEAGVVEDGVERRLGGLAKTSMDTNG